MIFDIDQNKNVAKIDRWTRDDRCYHRQPRLSVSEINFETTEPNMYVKLQAKLTAKESKYLSNSSK